MRASARHRGWRYPRRKTWLCGTRCSRVGPGPGRASRRRSGFRSREGLHVGPEMRWRLGSMCTREAEGRTYLPSPKRSTRPVSTSILETSIPSLFENIASSTDRYHSSNVTNLSVNSPIAPPHVDGLRIFWTYSSCGCLRRSMSEWVYAKLRLPQNRF
jgi:hypothetical protein